MDGVMLGVVRDGIAQYLDSTDGRGLALGCGWGGGCALDELFEWINSIVLDRHRFQSVREVVLYNT
jgi:hypothetical protein